MDEKDLLGKLDKQALIEMLMASKQTNSQLQQSLDQLNKTVDLLTGEVAALRQNLFGRSTEKNVAPFDGQLYFAFNEAEGTLEIVESVKEPEIEEVIRPKPYKRKKQKGKREEDLKDIPTTIVEHTLTDSQLAEAFPDGKWKRLPDVIYKRLEFHPASFEVIEHHVAVYAGADNKTIVKADRPADLFRNSIATPSLVAGILNFKYVNAMPIKRLADEFERNGVHIPSQNMCSWAIQSSQRYLEKVYGRMYRELFRYHVVHADETPLLVNRDGRPAGSRSYMWVYRSGAMEDHPFVLYEYQKTRKADHPREFLKDYNGICVTDGYEVYHTLGKERKDLKIAGCYAHARRKFADVVKTLGGEQKAKDTVAYKAVQLIGMIYQQEKLCAEMTPEDRLEHRKSSIAPLVDAFFAYLKAQYSVVAPKSQTGKGIAYCLNQEEYLRVFLTDGLVPIDNNAAERAIRPFCLGKKNWYIIDTIRGAKASAVLYSIAETAKANNLKPYEYFKYLLEELPKHGEFEDDSYLDNLLPWSDALPDYCLKQAAQK